MNKPLSTAYWIDEEGFQHDTEFDDDGYTKQGNDFCFLEDIEDAIQGLKANIDAHCGVCDVKEGECHICPQKQNFLNLIDQWFPIATPESTANADYSNKGAVS